MSMALMCLVIQRNKGILTECASRPLKPTSILRTQLAHQVSEIFDSHKASDTGNKEPEQASDVQQTQQQLNHDN